MLTILIALVINVFLIFIISYILPGVKLYSFLTAVILAVILGVANAFIHKLMVLTGIPTNLITYGFVSIILSTILIWLTSISLAGLEVDGIKWAFIFAFVISIINALLHSTLNLIR